MQTFLPYRSFADSAYVLDWRRLGKQRVECKQLILALTGQSSGWGNHPAAKMWQGFEPALAEYGYEVCAEWRSRGYSDSLLPFFDERRVRRPALPPWLGKRKFHASHRSNLLRKDPVWYGQFGWPEPPDLPYVWPVL